MVKIESAEQAKSIGLDFLAKMGHATWSSEIQSIKKSENKWMVHVKNILIKETMDLEIDAETGNIISYEKIK